MDRANLANVKAARSADGGRARIMLFGDFAIEQRDRVVRDPYYESNNTGFDKAYDQCLDFSQGLIEAIKLNM